MTFDNWLMGIPGYARSGFNRSLGRQCWEVSREESERELNRAMWALKEIYNTLNEDKVNLGMIVHAHNVARVAITDIDGKAP